MAHAWKTNTKFYGYREKGWVISRWKIEMTDALWKGEKGARSLSTVAFPGFVGQEVPRRWNLVSFPLYGRGHSWIQHSRMITFSGERNRCEILKFHGKWWRGLKRVSTPVSHCRKCSKSRSTIDNEGLTFSKSCQCAKFIDHEEWWFSFPSIRSSRAKCVVLPKSKPIKQTHLGTFHT